MAKKTMVQYLIVGTVDASEDEVATTFNPQVLEDMTLFLKNQFGDSVQLIVEHIEIVDAEEIA